MNAARSAARKLATQLVTEASPASGRDLVLADLDGVVYRGADAIPHAVESLNAVAASARVAYVTNNASRSAATVAEHLRGFGLTVTEADVVTSPQAAMLLLRELAAPASTVLVIGGDGLVVEVERAGFRVTRSAEDAPAALVQGFAPTLGWTDLAEAAFALAERPGVPPLPWVATNMDWTIPVARGIAPGNGTLVSAVHTAVGRLPVVAGKPERAIFDVAIERFGASSPLFIGDRLDTDVLGANRAGIDAVLVLTGIDGAKALLAAAPELRPRYILDDLRGLDEPYQRVESEQRGGRQRFRCGRAVVEVDGREVRAVKGDGVELVRAGSAAVWGSGHSIHALEVDPRLYS